MAASLVLKLKRHGDGADLESNNSFLLAETVAETTVHIALMACAILVINGGNLIINPSLNRHGSMATCMAAPEANCTMSLDLDAPLSSTHIYIQFAGGAATAALSSI